MATLDTLERMTSSEVVFKTLYEQITRLELLPGTKISETEIAKTFGFSRQPVREAFTRLANLNLLLVRPQRATMVRPFSRDLIWRLIARSRERRPIFQSRTLKRRTRTSPGATKRRVRSLHSFRDIWRSIRWTRSKSNNCEFSLTPEFSAPGSGRIDVIVPGVLRSALGRGDCSC